MKKKKDKFDLDKFLSEAIKPARADKALASLDRIRKRRTKRPTPELRSRYLFAIDLANILSGRKSGKDASIERVAEVAGKLERAAELYEHMAASAAIRGGEGRPPDWGTQAFVCAMARVFADCGIEVLWRRVERDGTERVTVFQNICNIWLNEVDANHKGDISARMFRQAKVRFDRNTKKE